MVVVCLIYSYLAHICFFSIGFAHTTCHALWNSKQTLYSCLTTTSWTPRWADRQISPPITVNEEAFHSSQLPFELQRKGCVMHFESFWKWSAALWELLRRNTWSTHKSPVFSAVAIPFLLRSSQFAQHFLIMHEHEMCLLTSSISTLSWNCCNVNPPFRSTEPQNTQHWAERGSDHFWRGAQRGKGLQSSLTYSEALGVIDNWWAISSQCFQILT